MELSKEIRDKWWKEIVESIERGDPSVEEIMYFELINIGKTLKEIEKNLSSIEHHTRTRR